MVRTKNNTRTSPSFPADTNRDTVPLLAPSASTSEQQQPALSTAIPFKSTLPTDWNGDRVEEAKKPKHQRDLGKAKRIITARLKGREVSEKDEAWAINIARKEEKLETAEVESKRAMDTSLTAADMAFNDDDTISELSSVADVSDLAPTPAASPKKGKGRAEEPQQPPPPATDQRTSIENAIATLQYDEHPADRPFWLTGLRKPFPHASLTDMQNFEVQTRRWFDEIERLKRLRKALPIPADVGKGEWHYEHFGRTMEVGKKQGKKRSKVFARGVWRYMVDGEMTNQRRDEYPLDLEGEPLGWGVRDDVDMDDFRVREPPVEETEEVEEEAGEKAIVGLDGVDESGEGDGVERSGWDEVDYAREYLGEG